MLEIILAICAAVALLLGWRYFPAKESIDDRLAKLSKARPGHEDWRNSVVDLMKLLDMDSSLENRVRLAKKYGWTVGQAGGAEMNLFLMREIRRRY